MSGDQVAFLKAIRANPADDTARLVYADWLDERGQSVDVLHASLIRHQVAIARKTHTHGYGAGGCARCNGERAATVMIRQLVTALGPKAFNPVSPSGWVVYAFDRGFVARVIGTMGGWDTLAMSPVGPFMVVERLALDLPTYFDSAELRAFCPVAQRVAMLQSVVSWPAQPDQVIAISERHPPWLLIDPHHNLGPLEKFLGGDKTAIGMAGQYQSRCRSAV